jgi:hypothetical protein
MASGAGRRQLDRIDTLFVQNGAAFSSQDGDITLHELADATVYFANRPRREAGHMPSRRFLELWDEGTNGFSADPPKAVLSFLDDEAETPADVVVVLYEPRLTGHEMTYRVDVLEGTLPSSGGPCSLFIDAFGSPLTPASLAEARRPRRRRDTQTRT